MARTAQVQPATPTNAPPPYAQYSSPSTVSLIAGAFELTVEWSGHYSVDKTLALFAASTDDSKTNASSSWWLVVTPLTSLVLPLVMELMPLPDPSLGWQRNWPFFLRFTLRVALMNFCIDSQIDTYIPEQKLPLPVLMLMNLFQSFTSACALMLVGELAGVFPIPFVVISAAPFHAVVGWGMRYLFIRMVLPEERDPVRLERTKQRLPRVMRLINFGMPLLYIYNSFAVAFSRVPEEYQVATAVLLQLVKLLATRTQWKFGHIDSRHESAELDESEDLASAHVASGARFFHALFTTTCLQKSKSFMTLVVVVFFSIVQELGTIRGLRSRERRLRQVTTQLNDTRKLSSCQTRHHHAGFRETLACIAERARERTQHSTTAADRPPPPSRSKPFYSGFHPTANTSVHLPNVARAPCTNPQPSQPLTAHETAFLCCATRLLHCQEAALLRFYVEIFVPVLYVAYVSLVQYTPNIAFLPALQLSDSHTLTTLAQRLSVQIAVQILALVFILNRHCYEPGGLRQLVFAVSSMRVVMLSNCVLNALYILDFPLLHNGHDFSFQFKWLHHRS